MRATGQLALDFHSALAEKARPSGVAIDAEFPEDSASTLANLESYNKHLYRPNTYLHKWWARRPGTTFRQILKMLSSDPAKRDFYVPGGLEGKIIYDPMMGGGTTLHEAIRLGANVIGIDIDPVPVLQAKATLGQSSLSDRRAVFHRFLNSLRGTLSELFKTTCPVCGTAAEAQFILYGLHRKCSCRDMLVIDDLLLRQQKDGDIRICPLCHEVYTAPEHSCQRCASTRIVDKKTRSCTQCRTEYQDILKLPFAQRYEPLIVAGACPKGHRFFKGIDDYDISIMDEARQKAASVVLPDSGHFDIPAGPKSIDLRRKGVTTYPELFTPRQIVYLDSCRALLSQMPDEDRLWMALLVSTSLEFNCLLCGYKGGDIRRPGAIRHVFSHHAYSFPYTALENNPVFPEGLSGTLVRLFRDRIERAAEWAARPKEVQLDKGRRARVIISGEIDGGKPVCEFEDIPQGCRRFLVRQADSSRLDVPENLVDYVVTDPPYHDNVQYSDLSGFFRVWLSVFLPDEADWSYDPLGSAVSEGGPAGTAKYEDTLTRIWKSCYKALKRPNGRLIFTFHHWSPDAWAALTVSLRRAGFELVNRYVVRSENSISVHVRDLKALKDDAILVLKPVCDAKELRRWPEPARITTEDSCAFCRECAAALGWFLRSDLEENSIRLAWSNLLEGKGNG